MELNVPIFPAPENNPGWYLPEDDGTGGVAIQRRNMPLLKDNSSLFMLNQKAKVWCPVLAMKTFRPFCLPLYCFKAVSVSRLTPGQFLQNWYITVVGCKSKLRQWNVTANQLELDETIRDKLETALIGKAPNQSVLNGKI